jgi:hypothetical protein
MSIRNLLSAAALTASAVLSSSAPAWAAPDVHAHWCALASFQITQVASLYTDEHINQTIYRRFAGAQVFLPAQPGLTPEWIRTSIARHQTSAQTSYECPLDIKGATVSVASGGTGFWVQISAKDPDVAKEILSRAKRLVR